ncbi:MAG: hypothetical protein Ct9H90mP24_2410 [Methanobacteriota archaeon]|nr:MAG: hypothetical protein Ct9H90mP24_2410 [Euryarchaeota archaeon]
MDVDLGDLCEGARIVLDRLGEEGDVWIVGGWVRDRIAGKDSEDLDLATNLIPSEVKSAFPKSIMVGEEFGTVLVRVEDSKGRDFQCEVTTLRKDGGYTDGRRPGNVTFGNDIAEDLARRDFTINAMAIEPMKGLVGEECPSGKLIDLDGRGVKDLESGLLRTVGQAEERIGEDGLRMVRAFRFLDLGEGGLREFDPELSAAISSNLPMLSKVSKERIWNEFQRVLSCSNSMRIVESMVEHGIFEEILPGISINTNTNPSDDHIVNLALICRDEVSDGAEMSDRIASLLRLSRKESSALSSLHECRKIDLDPSVESVRRFSATMSDTQKSQILDYMRGLGTDTEDFESELEQNSDLKAGFGPLVDGSRISEITGLEGGKRLGRLKDWLHRIQVERDLSSEEEVVELLAEFDWRNSDFEEWQGLSWP